MTEAIDNLVEELTDNREYFWTKPHGLVHFLTLFSQVFLNDGFSDLISDIVELLRIRFQIRARGEDLQLIRDVPDEIHVSTVLALKFLILDIGQRSPL
ncbi:MAG: hypothetical protein GY792_17700 [Gammaproteobacteria bacterium]|nr:hypothetical protein [Gammaproteobacteria bacterium]